MRPESKELSRAQMVTSATVGFIALMSMEAYVLSQSEPPARQKAKIEDKSKSRGPVMESDGPLRIDINCGKPPPIVIFESPQTPGK